LLPGGANEPGSGLVELGILVRSFEDDVVTFEPRKYSAHGSRVDVDVSCDILLAVRVDLSTSR
jgi:hypothetical protein